QYLQSPTRYSAAGLAQAEAPAARLDNAQIDALVAARAAAKQARDHAEADRIRATLREAGTELDDEPGGHTQSRRARGRPQTCPPPTSPPSRRIGKKRSPISCAATAS